MIVSYGDMKKRDWNQFGTLEIRKSNEKTTRTQTSERDFNLSVKRKIESPECDLALIYFQFLATKLFRFD